MKIYRYKNQAGQIGVTYQEAGKLYFVLEIYGAIPSKLPASQDFLGIPEIIVSTQMAALF